MCEVAVYITRGDDSEELLMEDVCLIKPDEESGGLFLQSIFGEQLIVDATIGQANFSGHKLLLKETGPK